MARMRTVKPEFFRSATIGKLRRDTRLLFIGMWTEADDHGRGLGEPRHLAGSLFPFDRDLTERKVMACLQELVDARLIALYEVNGSIYYAVSGWHHQKVNRPGDPRYPAPPSGTLFDAEHSVNPAPEPHPKFTEASLNADRQVSGVRVQVSGSSRQSSEFTEPKPISDDVRALVAQAKAKVRPG